MKTSRSQVDLHEHGPSSGLGRGVGRQLAALLLAVVVTPSVIQVSDMHAEPAPPLKRSATPGPRG